MNWIAGSAGDQGDPSRNRCTCAHERQHARDLETPAVVGSGFSVSGTDNQQLATGNIPIVTAATYLPSGPLDSLTFAHSLARRRGGWG